LTKRRNPWPLVIAQLGVTKKYMTAIQPAVAGSHWQHRHPPFQEAAYKLAIPKKNAMPPAPFTSIDYMYIYMYILEMGLEVWRFPKS
jgi:hypothetical protein